MEPEWYLKVALNQKHEKLQNHWQGNEFLTFYPQKGSQKSLKNHAEIEIVFRRDFFMKKVPKGLPIGALKSPKYRPGNHLEIIKKRVPNQGRGGVPRYKGVGGRGMGP